MNRETELSRILALTSDFDAECKRCHEEARVTVDNQQMLALLREADAWQESSSRLKKRVGEIIEQREHKLRESGI